MSPIATSAPPRELARHTNDGIDVTLFWERDGKLTVDVSDARTGEQFTLAPPPDKALAVFHHPFAYAARPAL